MSKRKNELRAKTQYLFKKEHFSCFLGQFLNYPQSICLISCVQFTKGIAGFKKLNSITRFCGRMIQHTKTKKNDIDRLIVG